jgi:hypothetical protein
MNDKIRQKGRRYRRIGKEKKGEKMRRRGSKKRVRKKEKDREFVQRVRQGLMNETEGEKGEK